jgi:hypothetical protein
MYEIWHANEGNGLSGLIVQACNFLLSKHSYAPELFLFAIRMTLKGTIKKKELLKVQNMSGKIFFDEISFDSFGA